MKMNMMIANVKLLFIDIDESDNSKYNDDTFEDYEHSVCVHFDVNND